MAAVVKAREERDTAHAVEEEARRQALKDDDHGDPVVRLLHVTRTVARTQCEKAIDAFLSSIKKTLQKHMPAHAQGPSDIECLEHHIPVPNECVVYDRQGVHSPGAGEAL